MLQTLPATPEHLQHELALQTLLGTVLLVTAGAASPDVERAFLRARVLCQQLGDTPKLFPVLWGLRQVYATRGELSTARELAEQLLAMAQRTPTPDFPLERGHNSMGITLFWLGDFVAARRHFEHTIALSEPPQPRAPAFFYAQDAAVVAYSQRACILWFLGSPDQALRQCSAALTAARTLAHPHLLAIVLRTVVWLHHLRGEVPGMHAHVEELAALASTEGFALWAPAATIWGGWIVAVQGRPAEGIAQIRQGLTTRGTIGAQIAYATRLALLAEAYGQAGQVDEGLRVVAEALAHADATGERVYEAELYRLKGEFLLTQEPPDTCQAERCFQQALAISRRQQAKSWELRAAMSLARLWQQQGKRAEAHALLAPIYGWFTEGFDTADLKQAKALLDELRAG
jgi:predicted ATPase